jgi:ABC-type dipeptide/oligopeptide/nickel transport system ATPase component
MYFTGVNPNFQTGLVFGGKVIDAASPNYFLLESLTQVKESIKNEVEHLLKEFEERLEKSEGYVQSVKISWNSLFDEKRSEYEKAIEGLGEKHVRDAQARLRSLRGKIDELKGKEKEVKSLNSKLVELKSDRFKSLEELKEVRKNRFQKRLMKVKEWEDIFGGQIRIAVIPGGDRKNYIEKLKALLTGSRIYDRDIEKIAKTVDPDDLVVAVKNNQLDVLIRDSGLSRELIKKLVEHLRGVRKNELYEFEIIELFDLPDIRFEVEPGKEKPLNELSVGTKSTVIVSLAMIEGKAPLVIDQPEESLDTQFIFDQIVKKLRREKEKRQFIFTTYNPNIVVSADAELNFVLSATAEKGQIQSAGGVDRFDTNKLILLHLEGGEDAFKLRAQKYIKV